MGHVQVLWDRLSLLKTHSSFFEFRESSRDPHGLRLTLRSACERCPLSRTRLSHYCRCSFCCAVTPFLSRRREMGQTGKDMHRFACALTHSWRATEKLSSARICNGP